MLELKHRPQVGQEPDAQAHLLFLGSRNKRNSRNTRLGGPLPTDSVRYRNERLPHVRIAVLDLCRQVGPLTSVVRAQTAMAFLILYPSSP